MKHAKGTKGDDVGESRKRLLSGWLSVASHLPLL